MYLQQLTNFADIENQAITPAFEKILLQNFSQHFLYCPKCHFRILS